MIKCDPSQTKTVVVLIVILVAAVVFTVVRIHPAGGQQQAAQAPAAQASTATSPAEVSIVPAFATSRNPFRRPVGVRSPSSRGGVDAAPTRIAVQEASDSRVTPVKIPPMTVTAVPSGAGQSTPAPGDAKEADPKAKEPDKPQFALTAVVGGAGGYTAVISSGENNTRVVGVGDVLDGGYKVQTIEECRVVLKNGRDVLVIKRP